jgi:UPF0042 nucleotide-binding protein
MVVVTGLSGAGKTVVLNALEDLGYFCIDNLPVGLVRDFVRLSTEAEQPVYQRMGVGIDARNPEASLSQFPQLLRELRSHDFSIELAFVEADEATLLRRFSETRRKHPLSAEGVPLSLAIERERHLLGPLAEAADLKVDTSNTYVHQLRDFVRERIARRPLAILSLQLTSFGFKHGLPPDADFVFDVRCLPNPHWLTHLRNHSGKDPEVIEFLRDAPMVAEMVAQIIAFLDKWIPAFAAENRSYLTIAVGCTGGHHRSVYVVEQLRAHFAAQGRALMVTHRDL